MGAGGGFSKRACGGWSSGELIRNVGTGRGWWGWGQNWSGFVQK